MTEYPLAAAAKVAAAAASAAIPMLPLRMCRHFTGRDQCPPFNQGHDGLHHARLAHTEVGTPASFLPFFFAARSRASFYKAAGVAQEAVLSNQIPDANMLKLKTTTETNIFAFSLLAVQTQLSQAMAKPHPAECLRRMPRRPPRQLPPHLRSACAFQPSWGACPLGPWPWRILPTAPPAMRSFLKPKTREGASGGCGTRHLQEKRKNCTPVCSSLLEGIHKEGCNTDHLHQEMLHSACLKQRNNFLHGGIPGPILTQQAYDLNRWIPAYQRKGKALRALPLERGLQYKCSIPYRVSLARFTALQWFHRSITY